MNLTGMNDALTLTEMNNANSAGAGMTTLKIIIIEKTSYEAQHSGRGFVGAGEERRKGGRNGKSE